jgi:phosphonatase-like hydrolase
MRVVTVIELAALDVAGTTVDEGGAVYRALADAVASDGPSVPDEAVQRWMGTDKREAIAHLVAETSGVELSPEAVEERYVVFRDRLAQAYAASPPQPMPGAVEAFARLRADRVKVALTTGFSRDIAVPLLAGLGWDGSVVDAVVCADEVPAGRPAPYMVFRAMELTGVVDVRRVLVAGDTVVDLRAGVHAGAGVVVGVTTGRLGWAELGAEAHTHLVAGVGELPDLVRRLRSGAG